MMGNALAKDAYGIPPDLLETRFLPYKWIIYKKSGKKTEIMEYIPLLLGTQKGKG